jgi:hypothetical protein
MAMLTATFGYRPRYCSGSCCSNSRLYRYCFLFLLRPAGGDTDDDDDDDGDDDADSGGDYYYLLEMRRENSYVRASGVRLHLIPPSLQRD